MKQEANTFFNLLIVFGLAMMVPIVLSKQKKLQLPIVVGEIIAGILIGKSGFNVIALNDPILEFLSHFGLIYLMFLSGIEIDFATLLSPPTKTKIKNNQKSNRTLPAIHIGIFSFLITILLSIGFSFLLATFIPIKSPWMMALIMSTTSLGVVVPVLKEAKVINSHYGQSILVASFIADFVTMLLITVLVTFLSKGLTLEVLLVFVLFLTFFLFYRFGMFVNRIPYLQKTLSDLSHATAQIKIRGAFALILIFIVTSEVLGTEVILGSFLAGVIIALIRKPNDVYVIEQLEAFGFGLFIPIFFINVGLNIDLPALFQSSTAIALVPILLGGAYLIKLAGVIPFFFQFSIKKSLGAGFLISSRLSLIIAASAIGLRMGLINDATNTAIILVAILTVTISPAMFMRLVGKKEEKEKPPILIIGANELGIQTADQLILHKDRIILADCEPDAVRKAINNHFNAVLITYDRNDPVFSKLLSESDTIICCVSDPKLNFDICKLAKSEFNPERVLSYVLNTRDLPLYHQIGVETTNAALDRAVLMALVARNPAMYSLLTRTDDDKELEEIEILNPAYIGKRLREVVLPGDVLILAMRRSDDLIVPHGDTQLLAGDHLTIAGSINFFEDTKEMFTHQRD
jgi:Kef-type K+ transport system membrane component KefB/Trk K+ transport system NAD-binding subunit